MIRLNKAKRCTSLFLIFLLILAVLPSCGKKASESGGSPEDSASNHGENNIISNEPETKKVKKVSVLAVGDNIVHADILADAKRRSSDGGYDFSSMYADVADSIAAADFAYINQEGPVAASMSATGYPSFNAPNDIGETLKDIGFDVINLANNHMTDKGDSGYQETTKYFNSLDGITEIGGYTKENYDDLRITEKNGVKIAWLSYTTFTNANANATLSNGYVIPYAEESTVTRQMQNAKANADIVIVSMHWGVENNDTPNTEQTRWANFLTKAGVDVILGMHPHVLQPIVWLDGENGHKTLCAYSLGNFFSGMLTVNGNLVGGMLTFDCVKGEDATTVENVHFTPTAVYFEGAYSTASNNRSAFGVYLLNKFTQKMSDNHGVHSDLPSFSLNVMKSIVNNTISSDLLN